jgi:hypothetical protein
VAQFEPLKFEVFEKPFKVEPKFEGHDKPKSYASYPSAATLPDKLKVWRVQDSSKESYGVVAEPFGRNAPADCEVLTAGMSTHKGPEHISVGRQGNFLFWGFSSPPAQMTDAGKAFYLNCLVYIAKFKDKPAIDRAAPAPSGASRER